MWIWYHLVTNNEWMTIARQIEFESKNWSGWKQLDWYVLHWLTNRTMGCNESDNITWVYSELIAFDPLWLREKSAMWWVWSNHLCNQKRQLRLFNDEIIWDFVWNAREHVNKNNTLDWSWYWSWNTVLWTSNWTSVEWNDSDISQAELDQYWPLIWITYNEWMWQVMDLNWTSDNIMLRWGSDDWDAEAWIYGMRLDENYSTWQNRDYWFRCAYIK